MSKKIKLLGISPEDTGVQFFRVNQPLRFIAKQNLAECHTQPFFGEHRPNIFSLENSEYFSSEGEWADVVMTTCCTTREHLALLLGLKEKYRLKLVVDLDDDRLSTHLEPNNPAYRAHLDPNARLTEYTQICLREADLVTVSTDYLKKKYQSISDNIVVIKNCIDPQFFKWKPRKTKDIVLGYAGAGSHQADFMMIEPILRQLKKKYGTRIHVLSPIHAELADRHTKWVTMLEYPKRLAKMDFTIGLAPLKDGMMARAKSNLRWLEYSILKIPTVASDIVPFRDTNAILVSEPEEWYMALEGLILDKEKRTSLGEAAYLRVREEFDPKIESRKLFEAIQEMWNKE